MTVAVSKALEEGARGGRLRVDREHGRLGRGLRRAGGAAGASCCSRRARSRSGSSRRRGRSARACSRCAARSTRRSPRRAQLAERGTHVLVNSLNPYRLEGQKTAAFEIVEELGAPPDVLALPYGGGGNTPRLCARLRGAGDGLPRIVAGEASRRRTTVGVRDPHRGRRSMRRRSSRRLARTGGASSSSPTRRSSRPGARSRARRGSSASRPRPPGSPALAARTARAGIARRLRHYGPRAQGPRGRRAPEPPPVSVDPDPDEIAAVACTAMTLRVRAPATTANVGPGFDCAGVALDLWNELEVERRGRASRRPADHTRGACVRAPRRPAAAALHAGRPRSRARAGSARARR